MSNIKSINSIALAEYREELQFIVERFFEIIDPAPLSEVLEAFEFEMFVDNNLADRLHLSDADRRELFDIQQETLSLVESNWIIHNVPEDILVEFIAEFDHDDDAYFELVLESEDDEE